jgi:PEP-CTERM motif
MTRQAIRQSFVLAMALSAGVVAAPGAQAAFTATFQEVGSDVVEIGGGALDLTDLSLSGGIFTKLFVTPNEPSYAAGAPGEQGDIYDGALSGPANWGSGSTTFTKMSSGDLVALVPSGGEIIVPDDYAGGPLSQTSTYLGASFSSLGLTPGAYVYSWGSGDHFDTYTINVGVVPPPLLVPEPSTWAMMALGFVGLGYAGYRKAKAGKVAHSLG